MRHRRLRTALLGAAFLLAACADDGVSPASPDLAVLESVSPVGGALAVDVGTDVVLTFSHPMLNGMEMLVDLHDGDASGPLVDGAWAWSVDRTRLTFTPAQPLRPATRYTIHLGGGLCDARQRAVDLTRHGLHLGGQWATGATMGYGGGMTNGSPPHLGDGWRHANGSYGMVFTFTTAG
jgi:hypothetical protein